MKRDENRNVEYKESWHDKDLEWICGYNIYAKKEKNRAGVPCAIFF